MQKVYVSCFEISGHSPDDSQSLSSVSTCLFISSSGLSADDSHSTPNSPSMPLPVFVLLSVPCFVLFFNLL